MWPGIAYVIAGKFIHESGKAQNEQRDSKGNVDRNRSGNVRRGDGSEDEVLAGRNPQA